MHRDVLVLFILADFGCMAIGFYCFVGTKVMLLVVGLCSCVRCHVTHNLHKKVLLTYVRRQLSYVGSYEQRNFRLLYQVAKPLLQLCLPRELIRISVVPLTVSCHSRLQLPLFSRPSLINAYHFFSLNVHYQKMFLNMFIEG